MPKVVVCFLLAVTAVSAQVTTATMYGIVTDSTGARVPAAAVTLVHEDTNVNLNRVADDAGEFEFNFLRVGNYRVRIEAKGFKRYENTGIELTAAQSMRQTFTLEVGVLTETVKVEGMATQVNTVSAEQLQTFDTAKVSELPLGRRNFTSLLRIGTGITMTADGPRMNGVGKNGTAYSVDGTDASANPEGRQAQTYGNANYIDIMSIEAIQEVHTVKGIIPAEYANVTGGQVNLLSRSGTNSWHGSLFENFQAENLNARLQFLRTKPGLTFNQFGASGGGPLKKDKIFLFGVYEGYREKAFQLVQANVFTTSARQRILTAQPSFGILLDHVPAPNQPAGTNPDIGLYLDAKSNARRDDTAVLKGDYVIGSGKQLALTYSRGRPYRLLPRYFTNNSNDRDWQIYQERGTAAYTMSGANWTSESRFGFNLSDANRIDRLFVTPPPGPAEEVDFGRRRPRLQTTFGFGTDDIELYLIEGRTWNIDQKYARHAGKHSFKIGGNYSYHCCQRNNPEGTDIQFTSFADMLTNIPSQVSPTFGNGAYSARMYQIGFFAQDDWRIRKNLVLNFGIRYDFFSNLVATPLKTAPQSGFYNPDNFQSFTTFAVGPIRPLDSPYEHDKGINLGPRIGFSYNPDGKGKLVIRGGYGAMFADQVAGAMWQSTQYTLATPFRIRISRADAIRYGLKWPAYNDEIRKILVPEQQRTGSVRVFSVFNPKLENPYSQHFTLGIQRELTSTLMLETGFVGVRGVKFLMHRWANQVDRFTGLRPNPLLDVNYYVDSSQQLFYASWQTSLRKRYSRNLSGSVHYTWGKSLSTGGGDTGAYYQGDNDSRTQDFNNINADRGPSTGDIVHYFVGEWIYELPRLTNFGGAAARHVLGGWQVSGILTASTGQPVSVGQSSTILASRADYVGGNPIQSNYRETLRYLNTAAFARVDVNPVSRATVRPGNIGNGAIRTPGAWSLDFSLAKNFSLTEQVKLKFGMGAFNFFNHTNLTGLVTEITNTRFGELTNTAGSRVIQLNMRLAW